MPYPKNFIILFSLFPKPMIYYWQIHWLGGIVMPNQKENYNRNRNQDKIKEGNLTYDDYAALHDDNRYELVNGHLELMSPASSVTHQMISFEVQKELSKSCDSDYVILNAPVDVILSPAEVRQPDLILIHRERLSILSNRGIEGSPDLVVEILSPSTLKRDKIDKLHTYANFRIPEYWIVEPITGVLEQHILRQQQYELLDIFQNTNIITSPTIPCISFTMAEIMKNIPKLDDK